MGIEELTVQYVQLSFSTAEKFSAMQNFGPVSVLLWLIFDVILTFSEVGDVYTVPQNGNQRKSSSWVYCQIE